MKVYIIRCEYDLVQGDAPFASEAAARRFAEEQWADCGDGEETLADLESQHLFSVIAVDVLD